MEIKNGYFHVRIPWIAIGNLIVALGWSYITYLISNFMGVPEAVRDLHMSVVFISVLLAVYLL